MTSVAFAPCFNALRFLFPIGRALILVVTGIEARHRACAQLEPDELGRHAFAYGDNNFLMADIRSVMAKITSRYGENYSGMAKTLWRAISNGERWRFMATAAFFAEAFAVLCLSSCAMRRRSSSARRANREADSGLRCSSVVK